MLPGGRSIPCQEETEGFSVKPDASARLDSRSTECGRPIYDLHGTCIKLVVHPEVLLSIDGQTVGHDGKALLCKLQKAGAAGFDV